MKRITLTLMALLLSFASWAMDLDSAKEMGLVGEGINGYLAPVVAGNTEAAALVAEINSKRKAKYMEIAAKQNTELANIEKIAGEKLTQKAAANGEYYQNAAGNWTR